MATYTASATGSSAMTHHTPFEEITWEPCCRGQTVKAYLETVVWPTLPTYGKVNKRWSDLGNPSLDADHWPQAEALHTLPRSYAEVSMFYELVVQYFTGRVKAFLEGDVLPPLSISDMFPFFILEVVMSTDLDVEEKRQKNPDMNKRQLQQAWTASINEHLLLRAEFIQSFINSCIKPMGPHNCLLKIAFGELFSAEHFSTPLMVDYFRRCQPLYPRFGAFTRDAANTEGPTAWRTVTMPEPRYSALDPASYMAAWANEGSNVDANHWYHGLLDNKLYANNFAITELEQDGSEVDQKTRSKEMQAVTVHEVLNTPASRVDLFKMLCATTPFASSSRADQGRFIELPEEQSQANHQSHAESNQQDILGGTSPHGQQQHDQSHSGDQASHHLQHTNQHQSENGSQREFHKEHPSSKQHYIQRQHGYSDPSYPAYMEPAVPQGPAAMPNVAFSPAQGSNHFPSRGSTPPLGSFHSAQTYHQPATSGSYNQRLAVSNGLHHSYPTSSAGMSIGAPTPPPPYAQYGAGTGSTSAASYTSNLRSSLHNEISGGESSYAPHAGQSYHVGSYAQGATQGAVGSNAGISAGSDMRGDGYYAGSYGSQSRYALPPSNLSPHLQSHSVPHWSERSSFGAYHDPANGSMSQQRASPASSLKRSYLGTAEAPADSKRSRLLLEDGDFASPDGGAQYAQPHQHQQHQQQHQHEYHQQQQHQLREAPAILRAAEAGYPSRSPVASIKAEIYSPSVGAGASGRGSESSRAPSPSPSLSNSNSISNGNGNGHPNSASASSSASKAATAAAAAAGPASSLAGVKDRAQQNREKMKRYAARVKRQREALKLVFEEVQKACEANGCSSSIYGNANEKTTGAAAGATKKGRGSSTAGSSGGGADGVDAPPHFATAAEKLNYQKRASKARKRSSEQDHLDRIVEVAKEACCRGGDSSSFSGSGSGAGAGAGAGTASAEGREREMEVATEALCEVLRSRTDLWEDLIEAERRLSSNTNIGTTSSSSTLEESTSMERGRASPSVSVGGSGGAGGSGSRWIETLVGRWRDRG